MDIRRTIRQAANYRTPRWALDDPPPGFLRRLRRVLRDPELECRRVTGTGQWVILQPMRDREVYRQVEEGALPPESAWLEIFRDDNCGPPSERWIDRLARWQRLALDGMEQRFRREDYEAGRAQERSKRLEDDAFIKDQERNIKRVSEYASPYVQGAELE